MRIQHEDGPVLPLLRAFWREECAGREVAALLAVTNKPILLSE
jgi:hypothetical protein